MARHSTFIVALLAFGIGKAAVAACTSGAPRVRVPEDCSTVGQAVGAVANGGLVDIAAGTYSFSGAGIDFSGGGKAVTLRARSTGAVVFSGGGANAIGRLGSARPVGFEGIRFVNGYSATANRAGAITLTSAEASFVDCSFEDNRMVEMTTGGGALGLYGGSRAMLIRTQFLRNRSRNDGGAIYAVRSASGASTVWLHETEFTGNASGKAGGAIYLRSSRAVVSNSRFESNAADFVGGAIYAFGAWTSSSPWCNYAAPASDVVVTRSYFLDNRADDDTDTSRSVDGHTEGGALHSENCSRVQVFHSRFESNESNWGGAISSFRARTAIADTVFSRNSAFPDPQGFTPSGGTIIILSSDTSLSAPDYPAAQITIDNSLLEGIPGAATAQLGGCLTVNGDLSRLNGGATFNTAWRANVTVRNSALSACAVSRLDAASNAIAGGAIFASLANLTLTNTLVLNASGDGGADAMAMGGGAVLSSRSVAALSNLVFSACTSDGPYDDLRVDTTSTTSGSWSAWTAGQSSPAAGILVAVPSRVPSGSSPFPGQAFLAYAWSGSSASLDGRSLGTPHNGVVSAIEGSHSLAVSGLSSRTATIGAPIFPGATLAASPTTVSAGGSTSLSWSNTAGAFVASLIDHGVGEKPASGSASTSPSLDTTFQRLTVANEGGSLAEVAITVSGASTPPPPSGGTSLFASDFESGALGDWSVAAP